MKISIRIWVLMAALFVCSQTVHAAELLVFAAASLSDALKEIRNRYEQGSPDRIAFNFDASSNLARQIAEGAPADIFVSADEAKMDGLQKKKLIIDSTRKSILSNTLVVVAYKDSTLMLNAADQLTDPRITRIAMADPASVPAGIYAKAFLENKGLWRTLSGKIVPLDNVRSALAAVDAGNAEIGFVYKTDAAISKKVKIIYSVPPGDCPSITYPMAVIKASKNLDAANQFVRFLDSAPAAEIFEKYGFDVLGR